MLSCARRKEYSLSTRELFELSGSRKGVPESEARVEDWSWDCQTHISALSALSDFFSRCCSMFDKFTITFKPGLFVLLGLGTTDRICFDLFQYSIEAGEQIERALRSSATSVISDIVNSYNNVWCECREFRCVELLIIVVGWYLLRNRESTLIKTIV